MPSRKGQGRNDDEASAGNEPSEPLVDRILELDLLREHVRRITRGEPGHAVLILGESGVGKSRLAAEAQREAEALGMKALTVHCLGEGAEALLPFKEGLAAYLGRSPDRIRRTLAGAAPHLLDAVPFIGTFLGKIGESLGQGTALSMKGVYEELARILVKMAGDNGLFILIEDLHSADQDTLFFLNYLFRKIVGYRVLVVVTIQEERLDDKQQLADLVAQWTANGYVSLAVVPLERAHVGEYVRHIAATGWPVDDAMVDRLFSLTGGNPFFLKETLNLLSQAPEPRTITETIPPRADAIIRRRLAKADETTLDFLKAASVTLDTTQDIKAIQHVMEAETRDAIAALNAACDLRLMREGPEGEISFVHSLMKHAVYREIGANHKRYLHERAGEWLHGQSSLSSAAYHYELAGQTRKMVEVGLQAASRAEQAGMYHTALMLYQKIRPHMKVEEVGPLLGRALIVLGDWDEAETLAGRLPIDDGRVRLLRSELQFVRGDFEGAKAEAEMAVMTHSAERIQALIRLSDIDLYLGDFGSAQRYGHAALNIGEESGSKNLQARCEGIIAATEFFGGSVDAAETRFRKALEHLKAVPEIDRDRTVYTTVLGNLGCVAEARHDWEAAERYHQDALRLRREVADARGVLHSLHALGRSVLGLGDREGALTFFSQAEELAGDLDETLERAKILHTRAELSLADGDCQTAYDLAAAASDSFTRSSTHYDVTHANLTLSAAAKACGKERFAAVHGALARASIETMGYGLLKRLYPDVAYGLAERIAGALTAYACGDALGLPWENKEVADLTAEQIEQLPAREDWARGDTSDDLALTLLVARYLAEHDGAGEALGFLAKLSEKAPGIRGLGPSTSAAIDHFRTHGTLAPEGGTTNGAPMRALPVGWVVPHDQEARRRDLAIEMSRATHAAPSSQVAACVIAACASWALEGASRSHLLTVATEEANAAARSAGTDIRLAGMLGDVSSGNWTPSEAGISLDPYETVTAVMWCVVNATSLRQALLNAVQLKGDTDTVAALVGGLIGAQLTPDDVRAALPWHTVVRLGEHAEEIARVSVDLATARSVLAR